MNAAFLLLTTTWLAGADPVAANGHVAPVSPGPVASGPSCGCNGGYSDCGCGGYSGGCGCDSGCGYDYGCGCCDEGWGSKFRRWCHKSRSWFGGCGCGCESDCGCGNDCGYSSCGCGNYSYSSCGCGNSCGCGSSWFGGWCHRKHHWFGGNDCDCGCGCDYGCGNDCGCGYSGNYGGCGCGGNYGGNVVGGNVVGGNVVGGTAPQGNVAPNQQGGEQIGSPREAPRQMPNPPRRQTPGEPGGPSAGLTIEPETKSPF